MTLTDELNALKQSSAARIPAEALAVMHRATEDLANSGQVEKAVKVGERAPDFTLTNTRGLPVNLYELLRRGPTVLSFYRGIW